MNGKTIMMSAAILLAVAGAMFGQAAGDPNAAAHNDPHAQWQNGQAGRKERRPRYLQVEKSAVSGSLAFVKQRIAIQNGDATYYLRGVDRLIGFVDGLKEGAEAMLEGYAFVIPQKDQNTAVEYVFHVVKLTFDGKEYDLNDGARFSRAPPRPSLSHDSPHGTMPRRFRNSQPFRRFEHFHELREFHKW
ncbi:MAG: hypothetical protein LBB48_06310 [Treponema sp.]|jgi:hypothetical protein|nr:hypothetical protein [Treponema sp.]